MYQQPEEHQVYLISGIAMQAMQTLVVQVLLVQQMQVIPLQVQVLELRIIIVLLVRLVMDVHRQQLMQ